MSGDPCEPVAVALAGEPDERPERRGLQRIVGKPAGYASSLERLLRHLNEAARVRVAAEDRHGMRNIRVPRDRRRSREEHRRIVLARIDGQRLHVLESGARAFGRPGVRSETTVARASSRTFGQSARNRVKQRRRRLHDGQSRGRSALAREKRQGSALGGEPRQAARADHEIELAVGQPVEVAAERNLGRVRVIEPVAFEPSGIGVEHRHARVTRGGEAEKPRRGWPGSDEKHPQRDPAGRGRDGLETVLEGADGRHSRHRPELVAFDGGVRWTAGLGDAGRKGSQRLAGAGREQQFRGAVGMLGGERGEDRVRRRKGDVGQSQDAPGAEHQAAPPELRENRLCPGPARLRQAAAREDRLDIDDAAVVRQSAREFEGGGRRPAFEQQRRPRDVGARLPREPHVVLPAAGERWAGELRGRRNPTGGQSEIGKRRWTTRPDRLAAHAAKRRHGPGAPIEKVEIGDDDPVVASPHPDRRALDLRARLEKARLVEADRQERGALALAGGEQGDESVEAGIQAGRVETIARISGRGRQQHLHRSVLAAPGGGEPPEGRPEVEPTLPGLRIKRIALDDVGHRGRTGPDNRRGTGLLDDAAPRVGRVRRLREARAAQDLDRGRRRLDPAEDFARAFAGERQRLQDLEVPQRGVPADPVPGDREAHLEQGGAGQQDLALDPVIGESELHDRVHDRAPFERRVGFSRANQGMASAFVE